jgi:hypothetical protein
MSHHRLTELLQSSILQDEAFIKLGDKAEKAGDDNGGVRRQSNRPSLRTMCGDKTSQSQRTPYSRRCRQILRRPDNGPVLCRKEIPLHRLYGMSTEKKEFVNTLEEDVTRTNSSRTVPARKYQHVSKTSYARWCASTIGSSESLSRPMLWKARLAPLQNGCLTMFVDI